MLKRRIPARDVVEDIRAGLSNTALKKKYDLSENLLRRLYEKLHAAGLITAKDYEQRIGEMEDLFATADGVSSSGIDPSRSSPFGRPLKSIKKTSTSGMRSFIMGASTSMAAIALILGILWQVGPINSSVGFIVPGGTSVNRADENGVTFLMKACLAGNLERVKQLIRQGANVNAMDRDSETALMAAAYNGHESIIRILLERGAVVGIRNNHGMTAIDIARSRGRREVERILVEHMKERY
jgi:hypothetical protein